MDADEYLVDPRPPSFYIRLRSLRAPDGTPRLAWALLLALGLPFALMAVLTILAAAGIYVKVFSPLWLPWPPDLVKAFIGIGAFTATLAYLAYRLGRRSGFRSGNLAGMISGRNWAKGESPLPPPLAESSTTAPAGTDPAPPPPGETGSNP